MLLTFIVDGIDDMHRTGKKAVRLLVQAEADDAAFWKTRRDAVANMMMAIFEFVSSDQLIPSYTLWRQHRDVDCKDFIKRGGGGLLTSQMPSFEDSPSSFDTQKLTPELTYKVTLTIELNIVIRIPTWSLQNSTNTKERAFLTCHVTIKIKPMNEHNHWTVVKTSRVYSY